MEMLLDCEHDHLSDLCEICYRPGDEVVDYKVREVDRITPALCEGAPVVTPANVSGTGNMTGAGITTTGLLSRHSTTRWSLQHLTVCFKGF